MKKYIISALAIAAMVGCSKSDDVKIANGGELQFSATATDLVTRTTVGDDGAVAWVAGEKVGISMFKSESMGSTSPIKLNVPYAAASTGATTTFGFSLADAVAAGSDKYMELTYPNSGGVEFVAYAPYMLDRLENGIYTMDFSDQTGTDFDIADYDFVMAKANVADVSTDANDNLKVGFAFEHKCAVLEFAISCKDDIAETGALADLTAEAVGINSKMKKDWNSYSNPIFSSANSLKMNVKVTETAGSSDTAIVKAVISPKAAGASASVRLDAVKRIFNLDLSALKFEAGTYYKYNVVVGYDHVEFVGNATDDNDIDGWNKPTTGELIPDEVIIM